VSALNENQQNSGIHIASVWPELVALRAGQLQPGADDTSSGQTLADMTLDASRDERAEVMESNPERAK
jgi:hypothetical protein